MTDRIALGVIGADRRTQALAERLGPGSPFRYGRFRLTAWAPSPAADDLQETARQSALAAVPLDGYEGLARNPAIQAVYIGGHPAGRARAAALALKAGKHVICPLPVALTPAELDLVESAQRQGNGRLFTPTDLRSTLAGRQALDLLGAGELGRLHAIYCAVRGPMPAQGATADVLSDLGWEALDFLLTAAGDELPERLYAAHGAQFGGAGGTDTLLVTLRFPRDLIVTLELALSLPAGFPAPAGDLELDLTGSHAAVRVEPYKAAVTVVSPVVEPGQERRLWHPHPVAGMLETFAALVDGADSAPHTDRNRRLLQVMAAIRQSVAAGDAVLPQA